MEPAARVRHALGEYPVLVAPGATAALAGRAAEFLPGRRLAVITDRTVARAVPHDLDVPILLVAPGEPSKSRARWAALTDRLLELGYGRDTGIVAIGGGVVGDLAGFVGATYLRGVPWLSVPTSLVAMVDAAIGGKTGVNTRHGKNLVGAFHPPVAVVADPLVLATLHPDHFAAGIVEALKHGLVADAEYFARVEAEAARLLDRDAPALEALVRRSVAIKAAIVAADEREAGGRAVLNAGHTVGHAIERVSGFGVSHGDAVAIGLVTEARLAARIGLADPSLAETLRAALAAFGRPGTLAPSWRGEDLLAAMAHDKKARDGSLRFALPLALGRMAGEDSNWTVPVPEEVVVEVLESSRGVW